MAKTDAASTKDFVDHSYFYKPYSIAAAIGFLLWAAYVCWTGYWGIMKGRLPVIDIGMQLAILWWLLDTSARDRLPARKGPALHAENGALDEAGALHRL